MLNLNALSNHKVKSDQQFTMLSAAFLDFLPAVLLSGKQ